MSGAASPSEADKLFENFENDFPKNLHHEKWYLAVIGALMGCGKPTACASLYDYLIKKPDYSASSKRRLLIRRIREAMVKLVIINGIPAIMAALLPIASREREEDKDYSRTRLDWQPDAAHEQRGLDMLDIMYQGDFPLIMQRFHAHQDLVWLTRHISYGLFLSDTSILNLVETELVVWPSIMCQNLSGPALWHIRCCLRAGVVKEDVVKIQRCVEGVARWAGKGNEVKDWPDVNMVKERLSHI